MAYLRVIKFGTMMDMELQLVEALIPQIETNTTVARKHVAEIERYIRFTKERRCATLSKFSVVYIPTMLLMYEVYFCFFLEKIFLREWSG